MLSIPVQGSVQSGVHFEHAAEHAAAAEHASKHATATSSPPPLHGAVVERHSAVLGTAGG